MENTKGDGLVEDVIGKTKEIRGITLSFFLRKFSTVSKTSVLVSKHMLCKTGLHELSGLHKLAFPERIQKFRAMPRGKKQASHTSPISV